jgi:copper homeostasis protein
LSLFRTESRFAPFLETLPALPVDGRRDALDGGHGVEDAPASPEWSGGEGEWRLSDLVFEICVDSVAGVRAAAEAGADRVELCADLLEGGITPSLGTILVARKVLDIKVNVMIRPRGGDFLYDEDEVAAMEADIASAKSAGVDGVVFGVLERDGRVNAKATERLIARARPASVTFHRAFDMTPEPLIALETLIDLGVDRILTSGQEPTAYEGAERIAELVKASLDRVIIMPGGGITARNASRVAAMTGASEIHFAARAPVASPMRFRRADVFMGGELRPPEYERLETTAGAVGAVMQAARRGAR